MLERKLRCTARRSEKAARCWASESSCDVKFLPMVMNMGEDDRRQGRRLTAESGQEIGPSPPLIAPSWSFVAPRLDLTGTLRSALKSNASKGDQVDTEREHERRDGAHARPAQHTVEEDRKVSRHLLTLSC